MASGPTQLGALTWSKAMLHVFSWGQLGASHAVIHELRLPRVLVAASAGASLAVAGALMQALFRNPLASPDVLGVTSGASVGAVIAILAGAGAWAIQGSAFLAGLATVWLVQVCAARFQGRDYSLALVLFGVAIAALASACVTLMKALADPHQQLPAITYWLMGSFAGTTLRDAASLWFVLALVAVLTARRAWSMNLLVLGDDEATVLGVPVRELRLLMIGAATLLTAVAVATVGAIGWIGLIVPHAVRWLVGPDMRRLLPITAAGGAVFMMLVDAFSRSLGTIELPPGAVTALIGAPALMVILLRWTQRAHG
jgi:iron complex transport system permease protein